MNPTLRLALVASLLACVVTLALDANAPGPVSACTGAGLGTIEEFSQHAAAIAFVEVVRAGGPENSAPAVTAPGPQASQTATPSPATATSNATSTPFINPVTSTPTATATSTPTPAPSPRVDFDLTGYGATMRVLSTVIGDLPSDIEVDMDSRRLLEQQIRQMEASLRAGRPTITPCPLGFGMSTYRPGERYVVILGQERGFYTMGRFPVEAQGVRVLRPNPSGGSDFQLSMTDATRRTYFPNDPYERFFLGGPPGTENDASRYRNLIASEHVPLADLNRAIQALRGGGGPGGVSSGSPLRIVPPDTGDGGLR